jgi:hypothetical protein
MFKEFIPSGVVLVEDIGAEGLEESFVGLAKSFVLG